MGNDWDDEVEQYEVSEEEEYRFRWEAEFANDEFADDDLSEVYKRHDRYAHTYEIDRDDLW
jgi:hypothetical protein